MKKLKTYTWSLLSFLFVAACVLNACKRESSVNPETISVRPDGQISAIDPCTTCQYEDFYKTVGKNNEVVGTVAICQTLTDLTLTFTVSNSDNVFNKTGYGIYLTPPPALNPSPSVFDEQNHDVNLNQFTYTIPLSSIASAETTIYIATYALVPKTGGMIWAGNLKPDTKNPNSRYFSYTIKTCETPVNPTADCFYTQGYWFAKPNGSQWPADSAALGGINYSYDQARAIFFGSNAKTGKTDAKQAFLQGLAYKLNLLRGVPSTTCEGAAAAAEAIDGYFAGKPKVTADNINKTTIFPANTSIKVAASTLSNCFNANHCGDAVIN